MTSSMTIRIQDSALGRSRGNGGKYKPVVVILCACLPFFTALQGWISNSTLYSAVSFWAECGMDNGYFQIFGLSILF
jgi:hypothetical protein